MLLSSEDDFFDLVSVAADTDEGSSPRSRVDLSLAVSTNSFASPSLETSRLSAPLDSSLAEASCVGTFDFDLAVELEAALTCSSLRSRLARKLRMIRSMTSWFGFGSESTRVSVSASASLTSSDASSASSLSDVSRSARGSSVEGSAALGVWAEMAPQTVSAGTGPGARWALSVAGVDMK